MRTWQFERDPMRELLALLTEPDAFMDSIIGDSGWTVEPRGHDQDISLAVFVSARDVHRGVSLLLDAGRAQDAWILYRTLLDATATLMWFSHEPSELSRRVRRYSWTSLKRADEFVKAARAKNLKWAQAAIDERGREMANLVDAAREDGIELATEPMPGTSELLTAVEQEDLYFWHARASLTVHPSFYGLSGRVGLPEGGTGRIEVPLVAPASQIAELVVLTLHTFGAAIVAICRLIGWDADAANALADDVEARAMTLHHEIVGGGEPS